MANEIYSLLFKKMRDENAEVVDLVDNFGMYGLSIPPMIACNVKEVEVQDFKDCDGEEVYDSDSAKFDAFDYEVRLGCKDTEIYTCHELYANLLNYFTNGGILHYMWSSRYKSGRQNVRFLGVSNIESFPDSDLFTFTLKLRVGDPTTEIEDLSGSYQKPSYMPPSRIDSYGDEYADVDSAFDTNAKSYKVIADEDSANLEDII